MRELGWFASDTSLFTSETGTSALSYMSHRSFSMFVRIALLGGGCVPDFRTQVELS